MSTQESDSWLIDCVLALIGTLAVVAIAWLEVVREVMAGKH